MADLAFCCMLVVMSQFEYSQTVSRTMGIQVNKGNVNPTHPRSRVLPPSSSKASAPHRAAHPHPHYVHSMVQLRAVECGWRPPTRRFRFRWCTCWGFFCSHKTNIFTNLCAAFSIFRCLVKVFYIIYKDSTSGSCGAYGYLSFFFPCSSKQTYGSVCEKLLTLSRD